MINVVGAAAARLTFGRSDDDGRGHGWAEIGGVRRWRGRRRPAALLSPRTRSRRAAPELVGRALALFDDTPADLDARIEPGLATSGATFLAMALRDRAALARMRYDQAAGEALMDAAGITTIALAHIESAGAFACRNAFAAGGVYEDPATGADAAAFVGRLRDIDWPYAGDLTVTQGEDMAKTSIVTAHLEGPKPASVRVSGAVRVPGLSASPAVCVSRAVCASGAVGVIDA